MPENPLILIIEDDAAVRRVIRDVLERNGNSTIEAATGEDAWQIYRQMEDGVQLVLSDVRLPGIDGNELARRIHEIRPQQRIIFVTAYPGDVDDSARRFEIVAKPFSSSMLVDKVNSLTARSASGAGS